MRTLEAYEKVDRGELTPGDAAEILVPLRTVWVDMVVILGFVTAIVLAMTWLTP